MTDTEIRTRFAPSPTGFMHVGNLRTALYAYLLAKKAGGTFILRIEDTDQARYTEGAVEQICKILKETGLHYEEGPDIGGPYGPYIQSERKALYTEHAQKLVEKGRAYYCFCDKERLDKVREQCRMAKMDPKYDGYCRRLSPEVVQSNLAKGVPFVIRQKVSSTGETIVDDVVFGTITIDHTQLDDQILMKTDGLPTYNFANVVDDHSMKITHIIRGNEFLVSSPKYNLLYEAFDWEIPTYVHVPPVMKTATQKLSKRLGDASYEDFIGKGYLKEALVNYIALLGWNPGDEREEFTLDELVEAFEVKDINKAPAIFDEKKLEWLNGLYLRKLPPERFYEMALPYIRGAIKRSEMDLERIAELLQPRVDKLIDIPEHLDFIDEVLEHDVELYRHKKMKANPQNSLENIKSVLTVLERMEDWTETRIHDEVFKHIEASDAKTGQIMYPMRVALSGKKSTPGGAVELSYLLGKTETLRRMKCAIEGLQRYVSADN